MSLPSYPEYKPSGVEWLGEVPGHWDMGKFRQNFKESPEKIDNVIVGEMLSVSGYRGIEIKEYDDENRRRLDEDLVGYRIVRPGQLVVNTMWLNYAGLGVSEYEGHVSPAYRSYWIRNELDKRFVHHLMRCSLYVKGYTKFLTGIRPNSLQMSRDDLMEFPVLIPPLHEQQTISTFLDRETDKIDVLIAEQQRLVALLTEKRQAVISHAVTKGLNPNTQMKDSGIEWLGEVPEHWEVKPFRRVIKKIEQGWSPNASSEPCESGRWGVLKLSAIKQGGFFSGENKMLFAETDPDLSIEVEVGDLLVTRANTPKFVGDACVVTNLNGFRLMLSDLIYRIHLNPSHEANYICKLLISRYVRSQIEADARGSSMTMAKISQEHINAWIIPVPPFDEQRAIADFLNCEIAKLNTLTAEANRAIELLQERRSALISAAVTGKIDVRGFA
jgi:type I restriction enzyme S subunit